MKVEAEDEAGVWNRLPLQDFSWGSVARNGTERAGNPTRYSE